MAQADLHLHSKYSDYPSTLVHKFYNSPESFTSIETIYRQAKNRGMDFVTITDHDDIRGSLELVEAHPEDCFISCEITAYFPEDNCKVHILVYDITEQHYRDMMEIRRDIYRLRHYIQHHDIAHSVAHATYNQDDKLQFEHIEKLVLLFDTFETRNGASGMQSNNLLAEYLRNLTAVEINALQTKHDIEPYSNDPWIKGFTGGSDDHCGLMIGTTYTRTVAQNKEQFIDNLRNKNTLCAGLHGDFQTFAYGVFKHIHDYNTHNRKKYVGSTAHIVLEQFFNGIRGNWIKRFKKNASLKFLKRKNKSIHKSLFTMLKDIDNTIKLDFADKIPLFYQHASDLFDYMAKSFIKAGSKNLPNGNFFKLFQNLSQVFPMALLSGPFLASLWHQRLDEHIKAKLQEKLGIKQGKKILWVSDKLDNQTLIKQAAELKYNIHFMSCDNNTPQNIEQNNISNFTPFTDFTLSDADARQLQINFPSLFIVMDAIMQQKADVIIISDPSPLGWIALLCGKLLNIPVKGIYSEQLSQHASHMVDDTELTNLVSQYEHYFYKQLQHTFFLNKPHSNYIKGINSAQYSVLSDELQQENNIDKFLQHVFSNVYRKQTPKPTAQQQTELEAIA